MPENKGDKRLTKKDLEVRYLNERVATLEDVVSELTQTLEFSKEDVEHLQLQLKEAKETAEIEREHAWKLLEYIDARS